jgi:hypothetical protein
MRKLVYNGGGGVILIAPMEVLCVAKSVHSLYIIANIILEKSKFVKSFLRTHMCLREGFLELVLKDLSQSHGGTKVKYLKKQFPPVPLRLCESYPKAKF